MIISFFSTQKYEQQLYEEINKAYQHQINFYDVHLNRYTAAVFYQIYGCNLLLCE